MVKLKTRNNLSFSSNLFWNQNQNQTQSQTQTWASTINHQRSTFRSQILAWTCYYCHGWFVLFCFGWILLNLTDGYGSGYNTEGNDTCGNIEKWSKLFSAVYAVYLLSTHPFCRSYVVVLPLQHNTIQWEEDFPKYIMCMFSFTPYPYTYVLVHLLLNSPDSICVRYTVYWTLYTYLHVFYTHIHTHTHIGLHYMHTCTVHCTQYNTQCTVMLFMRVQ